MDFRTLHLENVKYFAKQKNRKMTEIAEAIGISYVGFMKIIRENSTTIATLTRIARYLEIPIEFFFLTEEEVDKAKDFSLDSYIELVKKCEKQKEEIDELKNKIIRLADRIPL